jgi:hypothetical protein
MVQFIYHVETSGIPRVIEQGGSTVEAAWIPLKDVGGLGRVPLVDKALELLR